MSTPGRLSASHVLLRVIRWGALLCLLVFLITVALAVLDDLWAYGTVVAMWTLGVVTISARWCIRQRAT